MRYDRAVDKERGRALAAELISGDATRVEASLAELAEAPPIVTDAAAGAIAKYLREGGANARAICQVYIANPPPRFGGGSFHKVSRAFVAASSVDGLGHLVEQAMASHVTLGSDAKYLGKVSKAKSKGGSTGLPLRVLSVFKRPWVIAVFWLPVLTFGIAGLATAKDARRSSLQRSSGSPCSSLRSTRICVGAHRASSPVGHIMSCAISTTFM